MANDKFQATLCYLGIGSNLGARGTFIDTSIDELRHTEGICVKRVSTIYETDAVSDIPQGKYLNGVVEIETSLSPRALLVALNCIERRLGRLRGPKDAARTIDLDILYYGNDEIDEPGLVIPHPRIAEREFVLRGLKELGKKP